MGGFIGRLGPVIGYRWRGRWCMRSVPQAVYNPQTPRQMEHRHAFREQVRLAARMAWPLDTCLTLEARREHMTCRNLFMRINQQHFAFSDNELHVDYRRLQLSRGPVAPVAPTAVSFGEGTTLGVDFDRNPTRHRCSPYDEVFLYAYSPCAGRGYLFNPVYRHTGQIRVLLPDYLYQSDTIVYLMVKDVHDRWSATAAMPVAERQKKTPPSENPTAAYRGQRTTGEPLLDGSGDLGCEGSHLLGRHLDVVGEIEVARTVERHEVDVGMGHIDANNGFADLDAGTDLLQPTRHTAGK